MVTNDATIVHLKHKVMERVAKLAWEDNLNEQSMNDLCLEISPGPVAQYRCCVYKERTITSQRIRLSLAQNPDPDSDSKNIVQVIRTACEECPLAAYTVTDNCRLCMGKACINSCRFGAIIVE
jgi:hypothetical protein